MIEKEVKKEWKSKGVYFEGYQNINPYLKKCSLSLHLGRGEAFGINILETMLVGIPTIVSKYTGAKYAVACINGTTALQVSLRLAGVKKNDEVIVPSMTFIAPVNAISYNNAKPIFMDCDEYYTIDVNKTVDFINNETHTIKQKKFGNNLSALSIFK